MTRILSYYEGKRVNIVIITALIIIITNSFVIFSPDEDSRFHNAGMMPAITVGAALVICLIEV